MNTLFWIYILCLSLSVSYNYGTNLGKLGNRKIDDRITMLQMKSSNQEHIFQRTNRFKNLVIVFGVCLSLFMILSFNNWISSTEASVAQDIQKLEEIKPERQLQNTKEIAVVKGNLKLKTHHNFIASYLLQESSFERKNTKSKEQQNLVGHLKQLHKIIITQALRLF